MPVTPGPAGRYGHAACLLGSKFYIFGGQAEGAFMNDLWSYDIRQGEFSTYGLDRNNEGTL